MKEKRQLFSPINIVLSIVMLFIIFCPLIVKTMVKLKTLEDIIYDEFIKKKIILFR